jgi:hypothetical protein
MISRVATVYKPQRDVEEFLADTERTLTLVGLSVVIVCTAIGAVLSRWVTAPLAQLTAHAEGGRATTRTRTKRLTSGVRGRSFRELAVDVISRTNTSRQHTQSGAHLSSGATCRALPGPR